VNVQPATALFRAPVFAKTEQVTSKPDLQYKKGTGNFYQAVTKQSLRS
jgi:hypothetical protein